MTTLIVKDPVPWLVRHGRLAHAMGRRFATEHDERALCGAMRYHAKATSFGRPMGKRDVRCLRCMRILGMKPSKSLRERAELLNAELRVVHAKMRRCA